MRDEAKSTFFISVILILCCCLLLRYPYALMGHSVEGYILTYFMSILIICYSIKDIFKIFWSYR